MNRLIAIAIGFVLIASPSAVAGDVPLPSHLVPLQSDAGRALLSQAQGQRAFLPLISQYTTQDTQEFCGVASSVMVLNALRMPAPVDKRYEPYKFFTQDNFFSPATEAILPRSSATCSGMTIEQFAANLRVYGATARVVHAGESSAARFREDVHKALSQRDTYVVINYLGTAIGQTESLGHFSPLGAYAPKSDRVLVLDVSRYIYPPFWVDTKKLFAAMNTPDTGNNNRSRGYVIVSRPAQEKSKGK